MTGFGSRDRALQQALGVGGGVGGDDLQTGHRRVPGRIILAVLRADAGGGAVGTAEDDRAAHLPARHVERLGGGIDDLVHRLHGEVEGHELDDRLQPGHCRADAQPRKAVLGDRRVDDAPGAELLQQPLRDLVGALVLGDLLAHDEDVGVAAHLLGHGIAQRLADGGRDHCRALGDLGRAGRGCRRRQRGIICGLCDRGRLLAALALELGALARSRLCVRNLRGSRPGRSGRRWRRRPRRPR